MCLNELYCDECTIQERGLAMTSYIIILVEIVWKMDIVLKLSIIGFLS